MLGDKIKKLRKKKGLSQDNLARKADIPYTTLVKIESKVVRSPSVHNIAKIAKALDTSVDQLLED